MEEEVKQSIIKIIHDYEKMNPSICVERKIIDYPTLSQKISTFLLSEGLKIRVEDINLARVGMPILNGSPCFPQIIVSIVGE